MYAIRRVFDGKLLKRHHKTRMFRVTWCEFDDDIGLSPKESQYYIPILWPTFHGANAAMKLWRRGGWVRRTGISLHAKPERAEFPVEVVKVDIVPCAVQEHIPHDPSERDPSSVL